jgi:hypothetical protein
MKIKMDFRFEKRKLTVSDTVQILNSLILVRDGLNLMRTGKIDLLHLNLSDLINIDVSSFPDSSNQAQNLAWSALNEMRKLGEVYLLNNQNNISFPETSNSGVAFSNLLASISPSGQNFLLNSLQRGSCIAELEELFTWVGQKLVEIISGSNLPRYETRTFPELISQAARELNVETSPNLAIGAAQTAMGMDKLSNVCEKLGVRYVQITAIGDDTTSSLSARTAI